MATLSLTLPISCQICLGKVKDPVICPNNHAFCSVCLDLWLQGNSFCPTCRVAITKEKPYRKVLGNVENNEGLSTEARSQLRKTRLELLRREYENEIQQLSSEVAATRKENTRLKEQLNSNERTSNNTPGKTPSHSVTSDIEALSNLTKKLQEISSTYDDVRRDMKNLQEENEHLHQENNDLKSEVDRLKEDSMFTKSPKRYEKFTITGLKAKVDQYEKENTQLKKALLKSDKYVEQLQNELKDLKSEEQKKVAEIGVQFGADTRQEGNEEGSRSTAEHQGLYPDGVMQQHLDNTEPCLDNVRTSPASSSATSLPSYLREVIPDPFCSRAHDGGLISPGSAGGEYSRDNMFPATKKLLELKKIHETRNQSSPPAPATGPSQRGAVPAIDLPWSSCVSYVSYDSSSDTSEDTTVAQNEMPNQNIGQRNSEIPSCQVAASGEGESCAERSSSAGSTLDTSLHSAVMNSAQSLEQNSADNWLSTSPKRNLLQPVFLSKKIKVENP